MNLRSIGSALMAAVSLVAPLAGAADAHDVDRSRVRITPAAPSSAESDPASSAAAGEPTAPASTDPEAPLTEDSAGERRDGEAAPAQSAAAPPPAAPPATYYYVERGAGGRASTSEREARRQSPDAPPPPGFGPSMVFEPPPPPEPRHRSPWRSLWVGVRTGWFSPWGSLWAEGIQVRVDGHELLEFRRRSWSDFASSGPMVELDCGVRLARHYVIMALWERAFLGPGDAAINAFGGQHWGSTDLLGVALRFSTQPSASGVVAEFALGHRGFRTSWRDGRALELGDGWFEVRLGIGADLRVTDTFSLSPMLTLGSGVFGEATYVAPDGTRSSAIEEPDAATQHAAAALQIGGHFDLLGSAR